MTKSAKMPQSARGETQCQRAAERGRGYIDAGLIGAEHRQEFDRPAVENDAGHLANRAIADFVNSDEKHREILGMGAKQKPDVRLYAAELTPARVHRMEENEPMGRHG
jgi:hypothetical protein